MIVVGMTAYYNEIDPAAAHVLRHLIRAGVIAPGEVDTRSIKDVSPDDIKGFTQCHFFAGGGLWSVAARLAGWPDERPLWTGSCPCQPFSVAGKGAGADDPRHLWPDFFRLIRARRPAVVVGEQVAGAAGYGWFDGVAADLEGEGFAARTVDIPACAVDAPHIRQRLYWCAVGDSAGAGRDAPAHPGVCGEAQGEWPRDGQPQRSNGYDGTMEHGASVGQGEGWTEHGIRDGWRATARANAQGPLGDGLGARLEGYSGNGDAGGGSLAARPVAPTDGSNGSIQPDAEHAIWRSNNDFRRGPDAAEAQRKWQGTAEPRKLHTASYGRNGSFWSDAEWIVCHDGKARRAKSGLCLLVDGFPGRVDLWRIGGNAIVPQVAAEVIGALMDVLPEWRGAA